MRNLTNAELAMKDENDKALEKKNKSLNPKKSKKEDADVSVPQVCLFRTIT